MANTRGFELRPYRPADADQVVDLSLSAWAPVFDSFRQILGESLYSRVHPDWRGDQAASVRAAVGSNETWIAECAGAVLGFVNVVFDERQRSAEIHMIAVEPAAQRRGIGSALTELALDEMRSRGITLAIVATGGDPGHAPARAAYEKAGFTGCPQVWYAKRLDRA